MASITVLNESTNRTYTVTATTEKTVISTGGTGDDQYYLKVSTSQVNAAGESVPNVIVLDPTADGNTNGDITTAVLNALGLTIGLVNTEQSSSSSFSSVGFSSSSSKSSVGFSSSSSSSSSSSESSSESSSSP